MLGWLCEDVVLGVMAFCGGICWQFVGRVHVGLELVHWTYFHHYKIISKIITINSPLKVKMPILLAHHR